MDKNHFVFSYKRAILALDYNLERLFHTISPPTHICYDKTSDTFQTSLPVLKIKAIKERLSETNEN